MVLYGFKKVDIYTFHFDIIEYVYKYLNKFYTGKQFSYIGNGFISLNHETEIVQKVDINDNIKLLEYLDDLYYMYNYFFFIIGTADKKIQIKLKKYKKLCI